MRYFHLFLIRIEYHEHLLFEQHFSPFVKNTVQYIFYIVLILAIGIGATYFGRYINRKFLGIERHDETIKSLRDSLNSFIKKYDKIINEQQFVIDSLRGIEQKTITIYEKAESDFNDSNIISDDSVLRYIAKKIQD